jgi:hypothetical protein
MHEWTCFPPAFGPKPLQLQIRGVRRPGPNFDYSRKKSRHLNEQSLALKMLGRIALATGRQKRIEFIGQLTRVLT